MSKIPVIVCLIIISISAYAQKQEFSFMAGGGWQGMQYSMQHGELSLKPGFQLGFGYLRSIHKRWGIRTGLELGLYRSRANLDPVVAFSSFEIDSENSAFEYRVKANGYQEDQQLWTLNIPLMLQFHSEFNKNGLYAQLGIRAGIPVRNRYSTRADLITATGYYPDYNLEITELPVHGFGTQQGWKGKGEYDLKTSWSAAAELGWRWRMAANNNLYAGLYIDYGLNDINKEEGNGALLTYQPNGLAASKAAGLFSLKEGTGNARLMAYGIKLRIGLSFNRTKQKAEPSAVPALPPPPATVIVTDTQLAVVAAPEPPVIEDTALISAIPYDTLTAEELKLLETPFLFGKVGDTTLSQAAQKQTAAVAAILKKHPELTLSIEGHTCNIGSASVNERIGLLRAKAVSSALLAEGVEAGRLQPLSRAHLEPAVPNDSESNRKKNRRVVLKIL